MVRDEVASILDGKLVVVVNGASDLKSLGISPGDLEMFDLHHHWVQWNGTVTSWGGQGLQSN